MSVSKTLRELADLVGGTVRGGGNPVIEGIAGTREAGPSQITWIAQEKYREYLDDSKAAAIIVSPDFGPTPMPAILTDNMGSAVGRIMNALAPFPPSPPVGIHRSATIDEDAQIGEDARIGPNVVIEAGAQIGNGCVIHAGAFVGENATLGDDCTLWQNVVVREGCSLGNRVIVQANSVIGSDGYGYFFEDGRHVKIQHAGDVKIADDVEIGACVCIDRAKFGQTTVGVGTKIDNLVQVGHNAQIGAHCLLVGLAGVAGSAELGNYVVLGGHAGVKDHVVLHDGVQVAGMSVATKDIPKGMTVCGFPAVERTQFARERVNVRRLPNFFEQIRELDKRLAALEKK